MQTGECGKRGGTAVPDVRESHENHRPRNGK